MSESEKQCAIMAPDKPPLTKDSGAQRYSTKDEEISDLRKKVKQCEIEKEAIHMYYEQIIEKLNSRISSMGSDSNDWNPVFNFDEMNMKKQIEAEKLQNEKLKEEIKRLNEEIYELVNNNTEIQQLMDERKQIKHENNELQKKIKLLEDQLKKDDEPLLSGMEKNEFPFKKGIIDILKTNEKIEFFDNQENDDQFINFDDIKFEEIDYENQNELENNGFQQINDNDNDLCAFSCEEEFVENT